MSANSMLGDGLILAPSQVRGAFRLVPLLRRTYRADLRLGLLREQGGAVALGSASYISYIPHAFVIEWTTDNSPVVTLGTQLKSLKSTSRAPGVFHRMAKRQEARRLRFLPLHLAMEGFMAQHFGGPQMQWGDFSRQAMSVGMSPRRETSYSGRALHGLEDALRTFEIHEGQVGVLVFVAEALASAFVTPHPDDYRRLHDSLLQDFFGELLYHYALAYPDANPWHFPAPDESINSLADLHAAVEGMRTAWADFGRTAARGLPATPANVERVYQAGPFRLERFVGSFEPSEENHIGERIVASDGSLQYLKTFRLSAAQTRRGYLLKQLADHDWNVDAVAAKHNTTRQDMLLRYQRNGFGWLFHQHVMDAARAYARKRAAR